MLAAPSRSFAQPAKKSTIGYVSLASVEIDLDRVAAFREGLRNLGYIEGQNIILEQRYAPNDPAKALAFARELIRLKVAVIVEYASPTLGVLKTSGIPIVMAVHADPVGAGLAKSLARPGGTITGLMDGHTDLAPKRFEMLKEIVPSLTRVAVLFNPGLPHTSRQSQLVQAAAPARGVTVVPVEVKGPAELERAFERMRKERAGGFVVAPDPTWSL